MSECISNDAKGNIAITGNGIKTVTLNGKRIYDQEKIYTCNCEVPVYKTAPQMLKMLERILDYMTGGPILAKKPSVEEFAYLLEKASGER